MAKNIRLVQSVSVHPVLKTRMDKVKESVNWSAVACQAFEAKLNEIANQKETRDMSDVIERLRASKQEETSVQYNEGFELGQEWAKGTAGHAELLRLGEYEKSVSPGKWASLFSGDNQNDYGAGERLYSIIQPNDGDSGAAKWFWDTAIGEDVELTEDLVRGFAEGALDVWSEVEDKL